MNFILKCAASKQKTLHLSLRRRLFVIFQMMIVGRLQTIVELLEQTKGTMLEAINLFAGDLNTMMIEYWLRTIYTILPVSC